MGVWGGGGPSLPNMHIAPRNKKQTANPTRLAGITAHRKGICEDARFRYAEDNLDSASVWSMLEYMYRWGAHFGPRPAICEGDLKIQKPNMAHEDFAHLFPNGRNVFCGRRGPLAPTR